MTAALFLLASHCNAVMALPKSNVVGDVSNFQPDMASALESNFDFQDVSAMGLQRNVVVRKAIVADELLEMSLQRKVVVRKAVVADESLETEFADTAVLGLQQSLKVNIRSKPTAKVEEVLQIDEDMDALDAIILEDSDEASSLFGLQRSSIVQQRSQPVQMPSMRVSSRAPVSRPVVVRKAHCAVGGRMSSARS